MRHRSEGCTGRAAREHIEQGWGGAERGSGAQGGGEGSFGDTEQSPQLLGTLVVVQLVLGTRMGYAVAAGRGTRGGEERAAGDRERWRRMLALRVMLREALRRAAPQCRACAGGFCRGGSHCAGERWPRALDTVLLMRVGICGARQVWTATGGVGWAEESRDAWGRDGGGVYGQERQHRVLRVRLAAQDGTKVYAGVVSSV
ncbi:hypothetical protein B0H14DRAFT_3546221 [Mycena olivaceomarginata]|nr:hypothetical protein B0H14DRAFT_3546221 [Mycena olivaceomarginata]